jgi:hypothetical protein
MFTGHYKSVNGSGEFYSSLTNDINLPIQIYYKGENYILDKTYQVPSEKFMNNIISSAENFGIEYNVSVSNVS